MLGPKKSFGSKNICGSKKIMGRKIIFGPKILGQEKCCVQKLSPAKNWAQGLWSKSGQ